MIEKLHNHRVYTDDGRCANGFRRPSTSEIVDKVNEIIDVVNNLEDCRKLPHTYENCHNFTCRSRERDNGYNAAIEGLESLLRCRNYPGCASGKGCNGVCSIHSDICKSCENFGIPYSLLAERLQKRGING